jgi:hypothetical protein
MYQMKDCPFSKQYFHIDIFCLSGIFYTVSVFLAGFHTNLFHWLNLKFQRCVREEKWLFSNQKTKSFDFLRRFEDRGKKGFAD